VRDTPSRSVAALALAFLVAACGGTAASVDPSGPGGPIAEGYVSMVSAEDFTTHLEMRTIITLEADATTVSNDVSSDHDGADLAATMTARLGGDQRTTELVVLGDEAFARAAGGSWQIGSRTQVATQLDNFELALRWVDDPLLLQHVGSTTFEGVDVEHLTAATSIPYAPMTGSTGAFREFHLYVEDDGTPVFMRGTYEVTGADGQEAFGTIEVDYTDVGGDLEITAPT
jgi:hypothetical protein